MNNVTRGKFPTMTTPVVDGAQFFAEAQTEEEFQRNVIAYAKKRDWIAYHTHRSERSEMGFPDLVLVRGGRLLFVELKREKGGRVSRAQQRWIDELRHVQNAIVALMESWLLNAEGIEVPVAAYIWRPSDWPEIERVLA